MIALKPGKKNEFMIMDSGVYLDAAPVGSNGPPAHLIFTVMVIHDVMVPTRIETIGFSFDI